MEYQWGIAFEHFPQLLPGVWLTLELVGLSLLIGFVLAIPVSYIRFNKTPWLNPIANGYTFFFRGTPLLVQIFLVYYGLGQFEWIQGTFLWPFFKEAYWCAIFALSLNTAAYSAEILRGALRGIPKGEVEAAMALGMSKYSLYKRILYPRAFGMSIQAYSNEVILILKGSALASTITLLDITGVARTIISRTYTSIEIFTLAGLIYLVIASVIYLAFRLIEKRLNRYQNG